MDRSLEERTETHDRIDENRRGVMRVPIRRNATDYDPETGLGVNQHLNDHSPLDGILED